MPGFVLLDVRLLGAASCDRVADRPHDDGAHDDGARDDPRTVAVSQ